MAKQEDETLGVQADRSQGKCPRVDEEKEVEVLDAGYVAPSSTIVVDEWHSVLRPTTGEGEISTIWDRCFNFPKVIDHALVTKADEEKVKLLGLAGTCLAVQARPWPIRWKPSLDKLLRICLWPNGSWIRCKDKWRPGQRELWSWRRHWRLQKHGPQRLSS